MDLNDSGLEHLSRHDCLRLMGSVPLGRIVYSRQALPAVELVNFTMDDHGDIIIPADADGKLAAATRGAVVAFEADSTDLAAHTGWSVTAVGYAQAVTDSDEIQRLEQTAADPWAPGEHTHYIKVSPAIINGRRIGTKRLAGQGCGSSRSGD
jgi:uncharacterized protein